MGWAFATSGVSAPELFAALGDTALPRLASFKPQEVANLVWAFATAGVAHPLLIEAVRRRARRYGGCPSSRSRASPTSRGPSRR